MTALTKTYQYGHGWAGGSTGEGEEEFGDEDWGEVDDVIQLVLFERPAPTLDGVQKSLNAQISKVQR